MKTRKFYYLALCAIASITLSSCGGGGGSSSDPEFKLSDLQALWQENGTEHFARFTEERSDEYPYFLGRDWDEADEVTEQDLLDSRNELGHPGNGWFKYEFKTNGSLTEIHLMDNEGAEIPKIYVVSRLTKSELEYYEKDNKNNKFYFTKVVEATPQPDPQPEPQPEFELKDLQSLWQDAATADSKHYIRFTTEQSDDPEYFYGRDWDEAEEVTEQDLLSGWENNDRNGWFKYNLQANTLTCIYLLDNSDATLPKIYIVSKLTDSELEFCEKDDASKKYTFTKVTETK